MSLHVPSVALGLLAGAAAGVWVGADSDTGPPEWRSECAADAVRVFVSDTGDIAAIIDPECDDDRAGIDYPSEDA